MTNTKLALPVYIQDYFTKYLTEERGLSPSSIAAYRDAIKLFLRFAQQRLKKPPTDFLLSDITVELVLSFLDHLEKERKNLVRSRNHRLAAIKSLVRYIAYRSPEFVGSAQQLLAVPRKRGDTPILEYLTRDEMDAIIRSIDRTSLSGERDYVLFSLMYNTGARVSEALGIRATDISFDRPASVAIKGKGRKQRQIPLWTSTVRLLRSWSERNRSSVLFTNRDGAPLSRSGVEMRLAELVKKAEAICPSLAKKNVSPHTLRHTTAMHLLEAGVDITMIAMWLGHVNIKTTHGYVECDLRMKAKALEHVQDPEYRGKRYRPSDSVLAFLEQL